MATIDLRVSGYGAPYAGFNGNSTPRLTRTKCIKFAQAVGISHYSTSFGRTPTALAMATYRAMPIRCVLDFGGAALVPYGQYSQLESTEKINLSYWIGMTFTAFAADQVLSVPRTIHALQGGHRIARANPKSKSLADLIGQDAALNWHIFEAKGRQTVPSAPDRAAWKAQATWVSASSG